MSARDFAFVGIRLLAVWALIVAIQGVSYAASSLVYLWTPDGSEYRIAGWLQLLSAFLMAAVAAVLWSRATSFSVRISPAAEEEPAISVSRDALLSVGVVVVGMFLEADALPVLFGELARIFWDETLSARIGLETYLRLGQPALELLLGLLLLFGSSGVGRVVRSFRYGGRDL